MTATTTAVSGLAKLEATYRERSPRSAALAERANRVLPGGDTRAAAHHPPYPLAFASGAGCRLTDVDGVVHLDLLGNYTSLVHGSAYPPIVEAVARQVARGTAWAARHEPQVRLAEDLCARIGSLERVRFTNSGTEAAMLALHIARAATGRPGILMARGGYHGSHEATEYGTHHDVPDHQPLGAGVVHLADHGDAAGFATALAEHGPEIAAVFLEPVLGSGGVRDAPPGFLVEVAEAAHRAGALLVLDEVITVRLASGGAQQLHGVTPDLTLLGKLIGGGFPVGAVGGRADLLALTDPATGPIAASGTFNGNPVTAAAGEVSVRELTADRIAVMAAHAERLDADLRGAGADAGLDLHVTRSGSLLNLWLAPPPPPGASGRADAVAIAALHLAAAVHGVHLAPRGLIALSTVLTDADLTEATERLAAALRDAAAALLRTP